MRFIKLFEPLTMSNHTLRNRTIMPAMHLGAAKDGFVTDKIINFYQRRAQGGVGMIIVGGMGVSKRGQGAPLMLSIFDDKYIPKLRQLVDVVHQEGAKICAQLYHAGAYSFEQVIGEQAVSSSAKYSKFTHQTSRALTTQEVGQVQDNIVAAALRAQKAGFDAVEILSSAGYLIDQFLSPLKNDRTDRYGGKTIEDRLTFPLELISKLQKALPTDMLIGARLSGDDFVPGSNTYEEKRIVAQAYEKAGIAYLNVTGGWHETRVPQLPMNTPSGAYAYLAQEIKCVCSIPVFASNRINDPVLAENLLRNFYADAICFGRPLIADPDLPIKIQSNTLTTIRKCVGCNQGCFDHVFQMKRLNCMVNPLAMNEAKYASLPRSSNPLKILIIGAGPAGLEAARVLATQNHNVELFEKTDQIGGQINVAWVPPGRQDLKHIIEYYDSELQRLQVPIQLNTLLTPQQVVQKNPDYVIVGTGVHFNIPNIPGFDGSTGANVCFADEALAKEVPLGKKVVIIGGAATGVETALWAAKEGAMAPDVASFLSFYNALPIENAMKRTYHGVRNVSIFEILPKVGTGVGKSTKWVFLDELQKHRVDVKTKVEIQRIEQDTIYYRTSGGASSLTDAKEHSLTGVDNFILATGVIPNRDFVNELKSYIQNAHIKGIKIKLVGDAKKIGTILDAIHSGFKIAYKICKKRDK